MTPRPISCLPLRQVEQRNDGRLAVVGRVLGQELFHPDVVLVGKVEEGGLVVLGRVLVLSSQETTTHVLKGAYSSPLGGQIRGRAWVEAGKMCRVYMGNVGADGRARGGGGGGRRRITRARVRVEWGHFSVILRFHRYMRCADSSGTRDVSCPPAGSERALE